MLFSSSLAIALSVNPVGHISFARTPLESTIREHAAVAQRDFRVAIMAEVEFRAAAYFDADGTLKQELDRQRALYFALLETRDFRSAP